MWPIFLTCLNDQIEDAFHKLDEKYEWVKLIGSMNHTLIRLGRIWVFRFIWYGNGSIWAETFLIRLNPFDRSRWCHLPHAQMNHPKLQTYVYIKQSAMLLTCNLMRWRNKNVYITKGNITFVHMENDGFRGTPNQYAEN